jgi:hypothetical protein
MTEHHRSGMGGKSTRRNPKPDPGAPGRIP